VTPEWHRDASALFISGRLQEAHPSRDCHDDVLGRTARSLPDTTPLLMVTWAAIDTREAP
jgi:hypothetical protein